MYNYRTFVYTMNQMRNFDIQQIARTAHDVHAAFAYNFSIGHKSVAWGNVSEEHRETVLDSIRKIVTGEIDSPEEAHANFVDRKLRDGWTFQVVYDPVKKCSPRICPYNQLTDRDKMKERLFLAVVKSFL